MQRFNEIVMWSNKYRAWSEFSAIMWPWKRQQIYRFVRKLRAITKIKSEKWEIREDHKVNS